MRAKLCSSAIGASIKQNCFLFGLDDASCIVNCCNIAISLINASQRVRFIWNESHYYAIAE